MFKTSNGACGNVVLNFQGNPKNELGVLGEAYHRAGKMLVENFAAQRAYHDFDSCPIVFLYRHALELLIKAVMNLGNQLSVLTDNRELATDNLLSEGHGLVKHLPKVNKIFEAVGWKDAFVQAGLPGAEALIKEFEDVDPGGFAFRYSVKKDGTASVDQHFVFAPSEFAARLDPVLDALYGACIGLEEYRDLAVELRAEAAAEYYGSGYDDYYNDMFEDYDPF
ncbi:MAG: hypothetical protein LAO06_02730 [Acidobacteriia bacterium]|nr:hypothetical protein [Terriglobia bacterium]